MKLSEYVNNPMGKGSSVIPSKQIQSSLNEQYEILKENIKMLPYIKGNILIISVNVPSRHAKGLYYNVIFEFDLSNVADSESTINNLNFKCFSNCPSFTYTYANVFYNKGLLCPWLNKKYPKDIINKPPNVRNQFNIISYERSLYLAAKYIMNPSRNKLSFLKLVSVKTSNYQTISSKIRTSTEVEEEYKRIIGKDKKEKMIRTGIIPNKSPNKKNENTSKENNKKTKKVSKTKTIKGTSRSKKTKRI